MNDQEKVLTCDICKESIKDNKYYTCEACGKDYHHSCVYKEKDSFVGKPGFRKCKFCLNYMIDQKDTKGFYKKLRKKEEKIIQLEERKKELEGMKSKLLREVENFEEKEEYSEAIQIYKQLIRICDELEEKEQVNKLTDRLKELQALEKEILLSRVVDRKKIGGLLSAIKKKVQKSASSGIEAILDLDDYKDGWTLIQGRTPVIEDDFLFYQQLDEAINRHPNFLHLQIKQYLEELDYIIEDDIKPLPSEIKMCKDEYLIFNFSGYLSAIIECKREKISGYTKIYLKEDGVCFIDKQFGKPYFNGNVRFQFAGIVKNMDEEELKEDIENLKSKILEFLTTDLPFKDSRA